MAALIDVYPEWLSFRELEVSPATLEKNIRSWNKFFVPTDIINISFEKLTRFYLKAWASNLVRTYSMTRHYYNSEVKSMLNGLLDYAVELDYLELNRFRSVKLNSRVFKPDQIKDDIEDVFTLDEELRIIDAAKDDAEIFASGIPLGICILFYTGIRVGELCALKWSDLDGNILTIQRMQVVRKIYEDGIVRTDGYMIIDHTKTSAGYRRIALPDQALDCFKLIKKYNRENGISTKQGDYIFRRNNRYVAMQHDDLANSRVFDARLRKYCKHLNLPYLKSPHDIRRTYISMLLESGMNVDTIKKLAGHENIEMTLAYCRNRVPPDQLQSEIQHIFHDL